MIVSFRDAWLQDFYLDDLRSRHVPPDLEVRLFRRLKMIDAATTDQDLRVPPSNHFEPLRGNLAGWCSVRVNVRYRLVFQWKSETGDASQVYLDDHSYH